MRANKGAECEQAGFAECHQNLEAAIRTAAQCEIGKIEGHYRD